ncbi:MAG: hypothetical protein ACI4MH_06795 [Candidatus Coproplasma sp.]
MKKIIYRILPLIIALISATVAVFGWLTVGTTVKIPNVSGSVYASYFASGDGTTADSAYEINRPNHLYNLAWLQNNGYFGSTQYYFKITADLDMQNYVLPPIGTKENPFIGILDGENHTISNLTVSNVKQTDKMPNEVSIVPSEINTNAIGDGYTDIVGFFGVIGHYPGATTTCPNNVSVSNLYLDNITIRTRTTTTLIGLFAGYVCGTVENVGVYRSVVSIGSGVSTLSLSETNTYSAHSNYSLIGDYHQDSTGWAAAEGGTGGAGASFGGSIDTMNLIRRIDYMVTKAYGNTNAPTKAYRVSSSGYNLVFGKPASPYELYWKNSDTTYGDLMYGAYLPLNVDLATIFSDTGTNVETTNSTSGFHINQYYTDNNSEIILSSNTGYVVGGQADTTSTSTTTGHIRLRVQSFANTSSQTIYKSLRATSGSGLTYNNNNLDLVTNLDGTFYRIIDDYNKNGTATVQVSVGGTKQSSDFVRYSAVRDSLIDIFSNKDSLIYGLRFTSAISSSAITDATNISLNGNTIDSYQFISRAINFNLKQSGYLTAVLGSYVSNSSTTKYSNFSILEVARDSENKIVTASTQEITSVWNNSSGDIKYKYGATAVDSTAPETGYTKVYDKYWYSKTLDVGTAYYVEIPLKAGDYAIGAMDGNNAYLLYLDIGANGASGGIGTSKPNEISEVRFVYKVSTTNDSYEYQTLEYLYMFQIVFDTSKDSDEKGTQVYFLMTSSVMYFYVDETYDTTGATTVTLTDNTLSETSDEDEEAKSEFTNTVYPPS